MDFPKLNTIHTLSEKEMEIFKGGKCGKKCKRSCSSNCIKSCTEGDKEGKKKKL